jgi:hypothetical protein
MLRRLGGPRAGRFPMGKLLAAVRTPARTREAADTPRAPRELFERGTFPPLDVACVSHPRRDAVAARRLGDCRPTALFEPTANHLTYMPNTRNVAYWGGDRDPSAHEALIGRTLILVHIAVGAAQPLESADQFV